MSDERRSSAGSATAVRGQGYEVRFESREARRDAWGEQLAGAIHAMRTRVSTDTAFEARSRSVQNIRVLRSAG